MIETKGGDISAYISTNVISITDGQIFLETTLFFQGIRPAVNVGLSVSRVGSAAQIKAMKQVAGRLRLDLAQFRELEAFAEFGSDLDKASQAQLDRGARVVEILKQKQYSPYPVDEQVISIWAVSNGYMDDLPIEKVSAFESGLIEHIRSRHAKVGETIRSTGKLEKDIEEALKKGVEEFKASFTDRVDTVETVAAKEGVPTPAENAAAEGGDAGAIDVAATAGESE